MSEIKNTYYCPLCGTKTKDYFLVMGSSLIDSASDIKCSNKRCFFSSNYVPYRTWQHIADVKKNELNLQSENAALRSRIEELEKQAIIWHKYPDEKPDIKPIPSTKLHTLLAVVSAGGDPEVEMVIVEPTNAMLHWRRADGGWYAPEQILYWAYLPEPPREEG